MIGRLSLTARLTALFSVVSVGVLLGLALLIGRAVEQHFIEEDYAALEDKAALVRRIVAESPVDALPQKLTEALRYPVGLVVRVQPENQPPIHVTPGFDFDRLSAGDIRQVGLSRHTEHAGTHGAPTDIAVRQLAWREGALHYRAVRTRIATAGRDELDVIVGTDTEVHEHFNRAFRRTLAYYACLAALVSGIFGWWAARRGLQPLRSMSSRADIVTAQRLDERMPVDAAPVEIRELARTLNAMLERLQHDFARLSEFSSDLAHELRTPITNLMTQTQVVLSQPRPAAQYEEVLASNAEELQRLSRTVGDMLYLARVEQDVTLAHPEPLALMTEVRALFDFYEALAEERGVKLSASGEATVVGDRLMVRRALGNLLSNALRYTPRHGLIEVVLATGPHRATLAVENEGQEIPAVLLASLFERFFRGDKSRVHSDLDGVGLGLAITRAIAHAHGGTIDVRSGGGKTCFVLSLPLFNRPVRSDGSAHPSSPPASARVAATT